MNSNPATQANARLPAGSGGPPAAAGALATASRHLARILGGAFVYRAAALVLLAVCAQALGAAEFGRLEQCLALSLLIAPLASLYVYDAFLSQHAADPEAAASAAGTLLLPSMLLVLVSGWVASFLVPAEWAAAVAAHACTTIAWQYARNLLRAAARFDLVMRSELCMAAVSLGLGIALVLPLDLGVSGALVGVAAGNAAALVLARASAPAEFVGVALRNATRDAVHAVLGISARLVPNVLLWWGIELSDRLILARFAGDAAVGVYGAGARIAGILMAVALMLYQVWQIPAIRALREGERMHFLSASFRLYVVATSLCASGLLVFGEAATLLLFGDAYAGSVRYVAVLVPAMLLAALCYFFGIAYYSPRSRGVVGSSTAGFVASVSLNIAFIPVFGPVVAAFSTLAAYSLMAVLRYAELKRVAAGGLEWSGLRWPLAIVGIQAVLLYLGAPIAGIAAGTVLLVFLCRKDLERVRRELRSVGAR